MERRKHRSSRGTSSSSSLLMLMFCLRRTPPPPLLLLPLMTPLTTLLLLFLAPPTTLAFPLAAVAVTPTADGSSSVATASAWGIPLSNATKGGGSFHRRRWSLPQQQRQQQHRQRQQRQRQQQQQQQQQAHRSMLKPRRSRGLVSMALPNRPASVAIFAAGMVFGCCISSPVSANFRLYRTVPDIPKSMFKEHASLKGNVVTVSDGDSIRVRHSPNVPLPLPGRKMEGKKKSDETLQIRLYAVDCPEIAHFGNPAQPFSAEAKTFTKDALQGKPVRVKLLRMDQYNRAVCRVEYGRWPFRKDISAELLKRGLGVVYRQGGAEYDGRKEKLTEYENSAKSSKEGLWAQSDGETPAQYKARIKREQPTGTRR